MTSPNKKDEGPHRYKCILVMLLAVSLIFDLTACSSDILDINLISSVDSILSGSGSNDTDLSDLDLSMVDDDIEAACAIIAENASEEFRGGYKLTGEFFSWFAGYCGKAAVNAIAEQGNFEDPEVWHRVCGNSIHALMSRYKFDTGKKTEKKLIIAEDTGSDRISLGFTGDLSLAEGISTVEYMDTCENGLADCFSDELLETMRDFDIFVINNEFCYSDRGTALSGKAYTFRAAPERVEELEKIGTDVIALANNHVYDYGKNAFLDTLNTVSEAGYPYIGAGTDLDDAMEAVYYVIGGRKIAILAGTQIERSYEYTKEATASSPGVLKCLEPDNYVKAIEKAKKVSDYVIVMAHWGSEGDKHYGYDQRNLARAFARAGADVIIGGHTHCLQSIEYEEGIPVYYSLGNYWFTVDDKKQKPYNTGLARVVITSAGQIRCSFLPCRFKDNVTSLSTGEEKDRILSYMNGLSETVWLNDNGTVKQKENGG